MATAGYDITLVVAGNGEKTRAKVAIECVTGSEKHLTTEIAEITERKRN